MAQIDHALACRALEQVDLDWTAPVKSVWNDRGESDVPAIHHDFRSRVATEIDKMLADPGPESPLGRVVVGQAGSGKTHLVGALRRDAAARDAGFVLVDMTDVWDFWDTMLQGFLNSLFQPDGAPQLHGVLDTLLYRAELGMPRSAVAATSAEEHPAQVSRVLAALAKIDRPTIMRHRDVIRALFLVDADDFELQSTGYSWLNLNELGDDQGRFGLSTSVADHASMVVSGISLLMGMRSPTILALDQLDSIVQQHHIAATATDGIETTPEQQASLAIIQGIGGGLIGLRDLTTRTVVVLSCLDSTWEILRRDVVASIEGRFHDPHYLGVLPPDSAWELLRKRLEPAYRREGFVPPHPTWPYEPSFLREAESFFPRQVLRRCAEHRDKCVADGRVSELTTMSETEQVTGPVTPPGHLDAQFRALWERVDVQGWLDPRDEDEGLGELLRVAGECLVHEHPSSADVDVLAEVDFPGGHRSRPLHCRLRRVFRAEGDRERHLCLRALQHPNARAFQSRLKAAMTGSGIDRRLTFRHLVVVRTTPIPGGVRTRQLYDAFSEAGGHLVDIADNEVRTLAALRTMLDEAHHELLPWLTRRQLVSSLPALAPAASWLFEMAAVPAAGTGQLAHPPGTEHPPVTEEAEPEPPGTTHRPEPGGGDRAAGTGTDTTPSDKGRVPGAAGGGGGVEPPGLFPLGLKLVAGKPREPVTMPLEDLSRHTVVLGGSGSGKTVLVRRLVEEAALRGVPSIVIDGANDLARLGDRWPSEPDGWFAGDAERAARYHDRSETIVWTPGYAGGNPLALEPLPDLAAAAADPDDFTAAVELAAASLEEIVARGTSRNNELKMALLRSALASFGREGGGELPSLAAYLSDLPADATLDLNNAERLAGEMADALRAAVVNNPLLRGDGTPLDPAELFGIGRSTHGRTRVSVVNLSKLNGQAAQHAFVNQLAMALFTWVRKNPPRADEPMRGLLVIDEAKDLVPSQRSTPAKASLLRLAAQARKYGLGLVFATQEPRSIDNQITNNCLTQYVGRFASPAAITAAQDLLKPQGTSGDDVPRLGRGQFYVYSQAVRPATKVHVPRCLSHDPGTPLDEAEVEQLAKASRERLRA